ncbi:hypothetical protein [Actinosynnema mirum]|uniref:hypothetical protein n=1 Tax=Actinosynnema mirum TaxID=40567 RepID=UPI00117E07BC|nr:hypothetical protein [Actinosynnema mirum]
MVTRVLTVHDDDPTPCPIPDCGWAGHDAYDHLMNAHTTREIDTFTQDELGERCLSPWRAYTARLLRKHHQRRRRPPGPPRR